MWNLMYISFGKIYGDTPSTMPELYGKFFIWSTFDSELQFILYFTNRRRKTQKSAEFIKIKTIANWNKGFL